MRWLQLRMRRKINAQHHTNNLEFRLLSYNNDKHAEGLNKRAQKQLNKFAFLFLNDTILNLFISDVDWTELGQD